MKNMKKIFKGVAIAVALSTSASVFADSGSKFSAFDGVPTEAVSRVQLDAVSGEGYITKKAAMAALAKLGKSAAKYAIRLGPITHLYDLFRIEGNAY
ncbi:MAG: hypothetical protein WCI06_07705 [Methylococcaceae bacterium]